MKPTITQVEAAVIVAFAKGSPDYAACFPDGRGGINDATEDELKPRLQALHAALTARAATAGIPAQTTVVNGLITTWTALLLAADVADGTESGSAEQRAVCRKVLTKQLWKNALTIALQFIDQPEKADLYLPVTLLKDVEHHVPGACTIVVSGDAGSITTTGHANGADLIQWYQRLVGASAMGGAGQRPGG